MTRGIEKGQGQGLEAAAEAVEELLICRTLSRLEYLFTKHIHIGMIFHIGNLPLS